jgi:3-oxoacyl-[acyl-carrier protein] reductase
MAPALQGQVALVTGAATGIGRATALALAEAGAAVAINHWQRAGEAGAVVDQITRRGARAIAVEADVTQGPHHAEMLRAIEAALGPVDILVNNAGIIQEKPFLEVTDDDWQRMIATDLTSVFLGARAVLPRMLARRSGIIVNIASDLGLLGRAQFAPYSAAKAGVIGLTKALAREFAPTVRVNAVAPGPVSTSMLSPATMSPEWLTKELDIPYSRFAEPEEIAATVLFLCSDAARFYCGQVLGPNGGSVMP